MFETFAFFRQTGSPKLIKWCRYGNSIVDFNICVAVRIIHC